MTQTTKSEAALSVKIKAALFPSYAGVATTTSCSWFTFPTWRLTQSENSPPVLGLQSTRWWTAVYPLVDWQLYTSFIQSTHNNPDCRTRNDAGRHWPIQSPRLNSSATNGDNR